MGSVEVDMTCVDLDCGGVRRASAANNDVKHENIRFSKAGEGSCYSQSNLADGHSSSSDIGKVLHSERPCSGVGFDCKIDIESGVDEVGIASKRVCRICMLSLDSESSGIVIEFRCSCGNALGAAHQHCADQWFKTKENKICEICKSIPQNVVVVIPNNIESRQQTQGINRYVTNAVSMLRNAFSTVAEGCKALADDDNEYPGPEPKPECRVWAACQLLLVMIILVGGAFAIGHFFGPN